MGGDGLSVPLHRQLADQPLRHIAMKKCHWWPMVASFTAYKAGWRATIRRKIWLNQTWQPSMAGWHSGWTGSDGSERHQLAAVIVISSACSPVCLCAGLASRTHEKCLLYEDDAGKPVAE